MTKHELLYKKGYRWLACDDDGEIRAFKNKPHKKHPFDTSWSSDATLMTIETFGAKVRADTEILEILYEIKGRIQSKLNHGRFALNLDNDLICKCYIDENKWYAHVRLQIFNGSFYHESLKTFRILIGWFAHSSKGEKDRIARFIANKMLEEYYKETYMDYSRKWDKAQKKLNSKGNYLKDGYMLSMRDFE